MVPQADPQLIFQRIIMVAGRMTENIGRHFRYELCGNPSSLFSIQVDFFKRQIHRYLLIQSGLPEEGRRCQHKTKKMVSFVMFLMVAQPSNDYHGKEMTHLSVFATAMLTMSTQAYQSHHTV